MRYFVITPPDEPAVSLEEMKEHLRVDHDEDDERIQALIESAQAGFEDAEMGILGRPVLYQQIEIERQGCDRYPLRLFGPIHISDGDDAEEFEVLYRGADGADVVVAGDAYRLDRAETFSPRLVTLSGWSYGSDVRIRCWAGLPVDDPRLGNFKSAIKLHVQTIYDGVEDLDLYRATIDSLLSSYRVLGI